LEPVHKLFSSLLHYTLVFGFEAVSTYPNGLTLIYDSHRQMCPVLVGAIEGAAERHKEKVQAQPISLKMICIVAITGVCLQQKSS
jgi:hypothetical protein